MKGKSGHKLMPKSDRSPLRVTHIPPDGIYVTVRKCDLDKLIPRKRVEIAPNLEIAK